MLLALLNLTHVHTILFGLLFKHYPKLVILKRYFANQIVPLLKLNHVRLNNFFTILQ